MSIMKGSDKNGDEMGYNTHQSHHGGVEHLNPKVFLHRNLDDATVQEELDHLIETASKSLLAFLIDTGKTMLEPMAIGAGEGKIVSKGRAKKAMDTLQVTLGESIKIQAGCGFARPLSSAKTTLQKSRADIVIFNNGLPSEKEAVGSGVYTIDQAVSQSLPFLRPGEPATIKNTARLMKNLDLLETLLGQPPFYQLAQTIPETPGSIPLEVIRRHREFAAGLLALVYGEAYPHVFVNYSSGKKGEEEEEPAAQLTTTTSQPTSISNARWKTALALESAQGLFTRRSSQATINETPRTNPIINHVFNPLTSFFSTLFLASNPQGRVQASLLRDGYRHALVTAFLAISVHQIRRVLTPDLATFLHHPIFSELKFARSSPHVYLQEGTENLSLPDVLAWATHIWVLVLIWRLCVKALVESEGERWWLSGPVSRRAEVALDLFRGLFLVLSLARMEYAFDQAGWVAAQVYAYTKLLVYGNADEHRFLCELVSQKWPLVALQMLLVAWALYSSIIPAAFAALKGTIKGQPSLLAFFGLFWYATAHLVRYSNKYFVAIDMSDAIVTYLLMSGAMLYLGVGLVRDPLGMKDTRRRLSGWLTEAEKILSRDDENVV